jgi:uncharacterized protein
VGLSPAAEHNVKRHVTESHSGTGAVSATANAGQQEMTAFAHSAAVAPDERIESIDVIRGIALFGVLIVNLITAFRVSLFQQYLETAAVAAGADHVVERIVALGFEGKAFCLFALLFGVGMAIQYDRLCRHGNSLYWLFRRLIVLLAFGLLHLLLIWNCDILTEYAIAGLVALPLLLLRARGLVVAIAGFLALYAADPLMLYATLWPDAATVQHHAALATQVYAAGSFGEIRRFSVQELRLILPLHIFVFPRTLALFLLGALLWRAGVLKRPHDFRYQTIMAAIVGIVGGAALAAADTHGLLTTLGAFTAVLNALTPVLLALGYGAAILALMQISVARRLLSIFAPAGRMAFTNYVVQSVIFGYIFFGYGLGQFGRMGAATAFVIGVVVYLAQMVLSTWWLHHYRFGPLEWLWRTLMYGVAQPMRKV